MFTFIIQVLIGAAIVYVSLHQAEREANQPEPTWVVLARQERLSAAELKLECQLKLEQLDLLDSEEIYETF